MLIINALSLRATQNDATCPPASGASSASGTDPAGFASLLRQSRSEPVVPAVAPGPVKAPAPPAAAAAPAHAAPPEDQAESTTNAKDKAPTPDAAQEPEAPGESPGQPVSADRGHGLLKGRSRANDGTTGAQRGLNLADPLASDGAKPPSDPALDKAADPAPTLPTGGDLPIDPSVLHWLAGLQRAAAGSADAARGTGTRTTEGQGPVRGPAGMPDAQAGETPAAAPGLRATDPKDDAIADKARPGAETGEGAFAAMLAERRSAEPAAAQAAPAVSGIQDTASPAAPIAAVLAPPAAARAESGAPAALTLATPVTAPEFAQALGLQMSVLARDGVQHAELHLNPAEMGPVSVQIVMDGTQARVDFGADVAATRQAIEAGLPELASALRDAGFTLAGGGVSQHSRGRREGGDSASGPGNRRRIDAGSTDPIDPASRTSRRNVAIGGLDLYA